MRSLIAIQGGKVEPLEYGVHVPFALTVSEDNSDDEDLPVLEMTGFKFWITHANIQKGNDVVLKNAAESMDESFRFYYGPISYSRLKEAVLAHMATIDFTPYAKQWFADPASDTRH